MRGEIDLAGAVGTIGFEVPLTVEVYDDRSTRWASRWGDDAWWSVDLGTPRLVRTVTLDWERAHARDYRLQVSLDGAAWRTVETVRGYTAQIAALRAELEPKKVQARVKAAPADAQAYYADFADPEAITKIARTPFFHDGTWSSFRGREHGRPVDGDTTPGDRFVVSLQTHDQVGNRATGDRLSHLVSPGRLAIGAALMLT